MEQLYLIEIFVKKLDLIIDEYSDVDTGKELLIRAKLGPKTQFLFVENQMAYVNRNDVIDFEKEEEEAVGGGPPPEEPEPEVVEEQPLGMDHDAHATPHHEEHGIPHEEPRMSRDAHGNPIEHRKSGEHGKPHDVHGTPHHDEHGKPHEELRKSHDEHSNPIEHRKSGEHRTSGEHRKSGEHGQPHDEHGKPHDEHGLHAEQRKSHDEHGQPHDEHGQPHDEHRTSHESEAPPEVPKHRDEDEPQRKKIWSRTFRIGKSYLFCALPDDVLLLFEKYPLEFEVWSDEKCETPELVGTGNMHWHTQYFSHIRETMDTCYPQKALSSKEIVPIMNECCCSKAGDLYFILRVSPLGNVIMTEFQQLLDKNPDVFIFRTDKCPSLYECSRIEMDNKDYNTMGSLYEIACREDPELMRKINRKIKICTELESCGVPQKGKSFLCLHPPGVPQVPSNFITPKDYPIEKIKMGDIVGPCGNANCLLAHKMRVFIRNQYAYKKETVGKSFGNKGKSSKRVCGQCGCKHDLWHSEKAKDLEKKPVCKGCGGIAQSGETCDDRLKNLHGTGVSPINSKTELYRRDVKK